MRDTLFGVFDAPDQEATERVQPLIVLDGEREGGAHADGGYGWIGDDENGIVSSTP